MQDATAIIDGIKESVEAVGRSGHDGITLDNVSLRVDARELDVPHDSEIGVASAVADFLYQAWSEDPSLDVFLVYHEPAFPNCVAMQPLRMEHRAGGTELDLVVTLSHTDVVRELPHEVLVAELFLHAIASATATRPGFVTLNAARATVGWGDAALAEEPYEIEIPM